MIMINGDILHRGHLARLTRRSTLSTEGMVSTYFIFSKSKFILNPRKYINMIKF